VSEAAFKGQQIRAVILDVDGTMYRQAPLRRAMLAKLLLAHLFRPAAACQTFSILHAYRRAQERLRGEWDGDVATAQLNWAAERTGNDLATVARTVERWIENEPLSVLSRCIRPGLVDFLSECRGRGVRLGVLSDYPAGAKLEALGVTQFFETVVSAQEASAFKPDPRGLRVVIDLLGVSAAETLYVGDREDVDAPAAAAAGAACAIVAGKTHSANVTGQVTIAGFSELTDSLFPGVRQASIQVSSEGKQ
jgi:FMN phosphatase YigB (HAD superfamily)